jgi:3-hydroxyisobutyrate dehydrogenase-like beta-hydroxyacid dehydrogenase
VAEARKQGIYSESLEAIHKLYRITQEKGWGDLDYSAIYESISPPSEGISSK